MERNSILIFWSTAWKTFVEVENAYGMFEYSFQSCARKSSTEFGYATPFFLQHPFISLPQVSCRGSRIAASRLSYLHVFSHRGRNPRILASPRIGLMHSTCVTFGPSMDPINHTRSESVAKDVFDKRKLMDAFHACVPHQRNISF